MRFFYRWIGCAILLAASGFSHSAESDDVARLASQLSASDREVRREAAHQLQKLGPAAKVALPELIKALDDTDRQVWANAIGAIAAIGPDAAQAVPRLIETFDTRKGGFFRPRDSSQGVLRSAYALACIGEAARPALIEALKSDDTGRRRGAAKALGGMGPAAKDAIPALIENLGHADEELRAEVIEALGLVGAEAVGPLSKSLAWPDPRLRNGSARSLGAIGPAAAGAGTALLDRLRSEKEMSVRAAILDALPRVGLPAEKVVPSLIAGLRDEEEAIRTAAINALLRIHPAEKVAVPAVAALLGDPSPAVAERAIFVLGRFGPAARPAVPAIVAGAARRQPMSAVYSDALTNIGAPAVSELLRQIEKVPPASLNREHWVIKALVSIGGAGLPELARALESPSGSIRVAALGTMNELGEQAREHRAAILKLSGDPEPAVRAIVPSVLVSMKAESGVTLKKIEAAMRDSAPIVRLSAATAAGALGPQARSLAGQLSALIDDKDANVRTAAIRAAGATGGSDPALTSKLVARLDDPGSRSAALEALGRLGADSAAAASKLLALYPDAGKPERLGILSALGTSPSAASIELLTTALKDPDAEIRIAALRSHGKAQPSVEAALPALVEALHDPQVSVRRTAAEILGALGDKQAEKVVPALGPLVALLASSEDRTFALEALRAMHVRDEAALAQALAIPAPEARTWACERIAKLGSKGKSLAENLQPLLTDQNDYVRRSARKALEQIKR